MIIGAGGAVGKRLTHALAKRGTRIIAADRADSLPTEIVKVAAAVEPNVDVRDPAAISALFARHRGDVGAVWNLAAPLSVETAMDPKVAEAVTIGGMRNVLYAMLWNKVRRICFTDSIGSYGSSSPREECSARWLTENPTQDPGSDYGIQKRGCRDLLDHFRQLGGDPRWAVLPGVLHSEPHWGNGTTEFALEALKAAADGSVYNCPIDPDVKLPMVYVDDLMRGLLALQDATEWQLREPQRGYNIPGVSFSANELFAEIRKIYPDFNVVVSENDICQNRNKFAKLWPDTLSTVETATDLGYEARADLSTIVREVLDAHNRRKKNVE